MPTLNNLKIGQRLALLLGALLAVMAAIAGAGLWGQAALYELTRHALEEEVRIATTRFQRGVNSLGLPALAMPCGYAEDSRPYGAQIIGGPFTEAMLLQVGAAIEDRWNADGNARQVAI